MVKTILLISNHLSGINSNPTVVEVLGKRLSEDGWQVIKTSSLKNKFLRMGDMLLTTYTKKKFYQLALIEVYSGLAFSWAFLCGCLLKFLQKPFILTLHGGNLPNFAHSHPFIVRKLFSWSNEIYSPSPYLKGKLSSFYPNIKIIPNPIEIDRYSFRLRKQISPKLIWLRAFHEIYNPSLVPKILSILVNNELNGFEILMVGPDKGEGSLQRMIVLAEKLKVDQYIKIVPGIPKDQVPLYLNQGDVFINTTNVDNTPVSVIEAMASGLCIVSTNVGGIPYLLEHEFDALLVPPDDKEAMAAAILRLLNEPELAPRLSTNARKKAEHFDWSIVLPQWEKLFEEVLQNNH
ncbi:MAG TPA: glycosyl transferase family 1 [Candidatus Atribacteria bacterium]|nr:glycosyl transferase family 1 [Candidatus Atribacteria bacterium]